MAISHPVFLAGQDESSPALTASLMGCGKTNYPLKTGQRSCAPLAQPWGRAQGEEANLHLCSFPSSRAETGGISWVFWGTSLQVSRQGLPASSLTCHGRARP